MAQEIRCAFLAKRRVSRDPKETRRYDRFRLNRVTLDGSDTDPTDKLT